MHKKISITTHLSHLLIISIGFVFLSAAILTARTLAGSTSCELSLQMTPDKTEVEVGEMVTRTTVVKNTGETPCRDVAYSLYYAENEDFVTSSPSPRASDYYWHVGTLAPQKEFVSTLVTKATATTTEEVVITDACASARNANDACTQSVIPIDETGAGTTTVPVVTGPVPPIVTVPPVVVPATTTPPSTAPATTTPPVVTVPGTTNPPVVVAPKPATSTPPVTTTPATSTPPATTTPKPATGKERGMWIWEFPSKMLTTTADQQLRALFTSGFNTVYITIDDYLEISQMPEGAAKESAKKTYFLNLSKFVTKANGFGLAVDAEGGWKDWAKKENRWKGLALIDAAKEYNALYPNAKLRGFQYDVEPYLLPEYEKSKAAVLTDFVEFIDISTKRIAGSDLMFSMAIPHFYDAKQAWTPLVTYNGKTAHTFSHLLTILENKPGSMILIMSYRDFFEGKNGTKEIAAAEIEEATNGKYATKVVVSQETGNVDPDFVTYYGSTKAAVFDALTQIDSGFRQYSGYGGTAVHYLDSFLRMR